MPLIPATPSFTRYTARKVEIAQPNEMINFPHEKPFVVRYRNDCPVELYFYAEMKPGKVLYVTFHGATRRGIDTYPRFDRVGSLRQKNVPYLAFADPGLGLDSEMELSWYLGGAGWDPKADIVAIIRAAMVASGSQYACLVGGSGGGFAALRISHDIPDSLAFVFNPQIVLRNYIPRVRDYYIETMYGEKYDEAFLLDNPERYDLSELYVNSGLTNYVYYLQNMTDSSHVRNHYKPFKDAVGIEGIHGIDRLGHVQLRLIDSSRFGHKPPSPEEFDQHLQSAVSWVDHQRSANE